MPLRDDKDDPVQTVEFQHSNAQSAQQKWCLTAFQVDSYPFLSEKVLCYRFCYGGIWEKVGRSPYTLKRYSCRAVTHPFDVEILIEIP